MYKTRYHRRAHIMRERCVDTIRCCTNITSFNAQERCHGSCGYTKPEEEEAEDNEEVWGKDGSDTEEEQERGEWDT